MTRAIRRTLAEYRSEREALNLPRIRDDAANMIGALLMCALLGWVL